MLCMMCQGPNTYFTSTYIILHGIVLYTRKPHRNYRPTTLNGVDVAYRKASSCGKGYFVNRIYARNIFMNIDSIVNRRNTMDKLSITTMRKPIHPHYVLSSRMSTSCSFPHKYHYWIASYLFTRIELILFAIHCTFASHWNTRNRM